MFLLVHNNYCKISFSFFLLKKRLVYFYFPINICLLNMVPYKYIVGVNLMCTFNASCYSTRLSWAHSPVMSWAVCVGH